MRILHLMAGGSVGGIEILLRDFSDFSGHENIFCFFWGKDEPISAEMKERGRTVIELQCTHGEMLRPIKEVLGLCGKEKVDVMAAHHESPFFHLIFLLAKHILPGIKTLAYVHRDAHDWPITRSFKGRICRAIFRRSFRSADGIVAISESVKSSVTEVFGIEPGRIKVIYNGIPLSRFGPQRDVEKGPTGNRPLELIYVGRLIEEKGVQNILRGIADLPENFDYHFTVAGDGPYRPELEKLAAECGVSAQVDFLGTRSDVPELLEKADIFLHLPECEEGFGITVVEAMAAGKVCICGNRGAMPEIIEDGVDGFLVEAEDYPGVADKIVGIHQKIYSGTMQELMGAAVHKAEKFSIQHYAEELDGYLATL